MKRFLYKYCLLAFGLACAGHVQAATDHNAHLQGTEEGTGARQKSPAPQHGHRRGPKSVVLSIADDASIELWKPDLSRQPLEMNDGKVTLPATGVDNYHAIVARKVQDTLTEVAIRYEYARGKPSGHSTTELTAADKATLEIVPDPVPREHNRYYSDQTWDFIVRYRGQPLAEQAVSLITSHGSRQEAVSAADGRVALQIPDDFPDLKEGERDRRQAEFVVSTKVTEEKHTYFTSLNAAYRVNPGHWQSLEMGLLVVGLGMLAGGAIGRVGKPVHRGKTS